MTSALDLLKSTIDPAKHTCMPYSRQGGTYMKRVDIFEDILIEAPNTIVTIFTNRFSYTSGIIVWLIKIRHTDILRYVNVPPTTFTVANVAQANTYNLLAETISITVGLPMLYDYQCVLSPSSADTNAEHVSVRMVAGALRMVSDTTPVGLLSLSGTFTANSCGDINVLLDPNWMASKYALLQNGLSIKDGVKDAAGAVGVVSLIGPDYATDLGQLDDFRRNPFRADRSVVVFSAHISSSDCGSRPTTCPAHSLQYIYWGWCTFTPGCTVLARSNYPPVWNFAMSQPPSLVVGFIEINVRYFAASDNQLAPVGHVDETCVVFNHVYMRAYSGGRLEQYTDSRKYIICNNQTSAGFVVAASIVTDTNIGMLKWVGSVRYSYIGTEILVYLTGNGTASSVAPTWIDSMDISVRSVGSVSTEDSFRIARWDGFSPGQTIKLSGTVLCECLPRSVISSYVQSGTDMSKVCDSPFADYFISMAYNSDNTPFKRVLDGTEYNNLIMNTLPILNCSYIESLGVPRLLAAAKSCGIPVDTPAAMSSMISELSSGIKRARDNMPTAISSATSVMSDIRAYQPKGNNSIGDRLQQLDDDMYSIGKRANIKTATSF